MELERAEESAEAVAAGGEGSARGEGGGGWVPWQVPEAGVCASVGLEQARPTPV